MLNIKTRESEFGKVITISDRTRTLEILFGGNGDLYFHPLVFGKELFECSKPIVFAIEESEEIYPLFDRLYNKILAYSPYDGNDKNICEVERKRDSYREYPLVHEGIISWHSDEDMQEESSVLNISKNNNKILLEFIKSKPVLDIYMTYAIRFRNSGSAYKPFNCRFMELYNALCTMDFEYHQITIEEYLKDQVLTLMKK